MTDDERQSAKIANFGLLFGAGAGTLLKQAVSQYGVDWDLDKAQEIVTGFRSSYPTLLEWQRNTGEGTSKSVYTKIGRRRILVDKDDKFTNRVNTPIQGTAGDIAKLALIKLWEYLCANPDEAYLVGTVHDEILLEVRNEHEVKWGGKYRINEEGKRELVEAGLLQRAMEDAGNAIIRSVPIVADCKSGLSWAEAK